LQRDPRRHPPPRGGNRGGERRMKPRPGRTGKMKVVSIRRALHAVPPKDAGKAALEQLSRILSSVSFRQVDRLKRFLGFIVTEAVEGRGDQLKEYVIGVQVFDKDASFDPR